MFLLVLLLFAGCNARKSADKSTESLCDSTQNFENGTFASCFEDCVSFLGTGLQSLSDRLSSLKKFFFVTPSCGQPNQR